MLPDPLSKENRDEFRSKLSRAKKILLGLDYDGTLVNFTPDPRETTTPPEVIESLTDILQNGGKITPAVISGRTLDHLNNLLPINGLILAGLHGAEIQLASGEILVHPQAKQYRDLIQRIKPRLDEVFSSAQGAIVEDKTYAVALHYRKFNGNSHELISRFYDEIEKIGGGVGELQVIEGSKVIELRPAKCHKGSAVRLIQSKVGNPDLTIYIGDDTTDEDAFTALNNRGEISILVSDKKSPETAAQYQLKNPFRVMEFLSFIENCLQGIRS